MWTGPEGRSVPYSTLLRWFSPAKEAGLKRGLSKFLENGELIRTDDGYTLTSKGRARLSNTVAPVEPPVEPTLSDSGYLQSAKALLKAFLEANDFPESHGFDHACTVLRYCQEALPDPPTTFGPVRSDWRHTEYLTVCLAALLHDVDDRKMPQVEPVPAKSESHTLPNAQAILDLLFDGQGPKKGHWSVSVKNHVLTAIALVSTYENGNDLPEELPFPDMLVPRYADRLAASGEEGIYRCYAYTAEQNRPLYLPNTPLPKTELELEVAMGDGLDRYRESDGQSDSMVDHFFDKLLHIATPRRLPHEYRTPALAHLEGRLVERAKPLQDIVMMPRAGLHKRLKEITSRFHRCDSVDCPICKYDPAPEFSTRPLRKPDGSFVSARDWFELDEIDAKSFSELGYDSAFQVLGQLMVGDNDTARRWLDEHLECVACHSRILYRAFEWLDAHSGRLPGRPLPAEPAEDSE